MKGADQSLPSPGSTLLWQQKSHRYRFVSRRRGLRSLAFLFALGIIVLLLHNGVLHRSFNFFSTYTSSAASLDVLQHRHGLLGKCRVIRTRAGPPEDYRPESRIEEAYNVTSGKKGKGSDRYVPETPAVLIKHARIWTGQRNGTSTVYGDILLDKGLIVAIGHLHKPDIDEFIPEDSEERKKLVVMDVQGKWVTPGLVDLHSHIGVYSAPALDGADDGNSYKAPVLPWLRSIDGLNTHDESYRLAIAGGVTTAQVLPGSAGNIGGQAFLIKLRPTSEGSASSKVLEHPQTLHYPGASSSRYTHWRHMKHACGENPNRIYNQSRMDAAWNFRQAYNEALKIKQDQDRFCKHAEAGEWEILEADTAEHKRKNGKVFAKFPEDLQWESLVDVLRGKVKLSVHCYEVVDLDTIVRLSNEFQFPVASFHHAGETYLVPDLLKKTWGGTPAVALFASNFRKKREAYRGSEFAPRILADHHIPVVMKSDHPVLNSRYLLFEAQQAHYHGLNAALALSSITSVPAGAAGMGHRVGRIARGYDADIAVWDSHPLRIGATPVQVFIDGIPQLDNPFVVEKPGPLQEAPFTPDWLCEAKEAVRWVGLPPLQGHRLGALSQGHKYAIKSGEAIRFERVNSAWIGSENGEIVNVLANNSGEVIEAVGNNVIVIRDGKIDCIGREPDGCKDASADGDLVIDVKNGSLAPGWTTFGSPLGLSEILYEASTRDGHVFDPLTEGDAAGLIGNGTLVRAVDGLQFGGRDTLLAYRHGVTTAITAPTGKGFLLGLSTAFDTGASNSLEDGAIFREETALHVAISPLLSVSVSTQLATLRRLLFEDVVKPAWFRVRKGEIPLVVHVDSADIMSTLIKLKMDYEETMGATLRLTFAGGAEAHLIADKISKAGISVVVLMPRPFPDTWEKSRFLPGPPLSADSLITVLLEKGVNVAIGTTKGYAVRNTRLEAAWTILNSPRRMPPGQIYALATTNLERALGIDRNWYELRDVVIYAGGSEFDIESKVVGIFSPRRRVFETFRCTA